MALEELVATLTDRGLTGLLPIVHFEFAKLEASAGKPDAARRHVEAMTAPLAAHSDARLHAEGERILGSL